MPFCETTLRAQKPRNPAYPARLATLGDHVRARRLDLGLLQRDVAEAVGVDELTVTNWEKGHRSPDLRLVPQVLAFLGYEPECVLPRDRGRALVAFRRSRGMSQEELARALGVNPWTLGRWERGASWPTREQLEGLRWDWPGAEELVHQVLGTHCSEHGCREPRR